MLLLHSLSAIYPRHSPCSPSRNSILGARLHLPSPSHLSSFHTLYPPLKAPYTDPKSTLRYHNAEVYEVLKNFQPAVIQTYLAVRGQGVVLR